MSTKMLNKLQIFNNELTLISLNAKIESSKVSEEDSKRFSIIADEMAILSKKLETLIKELDQQFKKEN